MPDIAEIQRALADVESEFDELTQAQDTYSREMAIAALGIALQELRSRVGSAPTPPET